MDALKSVENEVDKVLRLFSNCRDNNDTKIDHLIEMLKKAKQDIDKQTIRKYDKFLHY